MEAIRSQAGHVAARVLLTVLGVALLWFAPATITGLLVMFVGLVCTVSGLLAGDFIPNAVDALTERMQATVARRAS
jgi:hypothetical protein